MGARQKRRVSKSQKSRELDFEMLESKDLLTGVSLLGNGTLLISGTNSSEVSVVSQTGNTVQATLTGFESQTFAAQDVDLIRFIGRNGDDSFTNNTNIAARALGFGGNDRLVGGSANDFLQGGNGDDTLIGNAGNDRISGNSGNDSLVGGDNVDRLRGGSGNDVINGGGGFDFLFGDGGDDVSAYADVFSTYDLSADGSAVVFLSANGTEANRSIEVFRFADGDLINNNPNVPNPGPSGPVAPADPSDPANPTPVTSAPTPTPAPTPAPTDNGSTDPVVPPAPVEENVSGFNQAETVSLNLLNSFRASNGLGPLSATSSALNNFSESWARTLGQRGQVFEHSPDADQRALTIEEGNVRYGENIVRVNDFEGQTLQQVAERMHQLWIDSPSHRANMLTPQFDRVGVGIVLGSDGFWYGAHNFQGTT